MVVLVMFEVKGPKFELRRSAFGQIDESTS